MKVLSNLSLYGTLGLNSVADANTDTDKFLVMDSNGIVKYRTGQELYNDIGAGGAAAYTSVLQHEVKAGVALTKGQAVYVTSADGTNMIVGKASNASEATSSKTLGLIAQDLAINGKGFVITEGLLSGLNTMAAGSEGDPVWLGTDGNLIYGLGSKPYAPDHLVFIGIVTRKNANNGEIFVKVQNGFELQELHNVQITSAPSDNTVLAYESSTSLYKMKSISTLLGYTPTTNARTLTINGTSYDLSADRSWSVGTTTGSGSSGQVAYWNGSSSQTGSNNLFWDTTNNRLGIGLTNPQRRLEIYSTTADSHLRLSGSAPSVSLGEAITGSIYQAKFGLATASGQYSTSAAAGDFVIISQTGATIWMTGTTDRLKLFYGGNFVVGGGSDSGLAKLQVVGAIQQSSVTSSMIKVDSNGVIVAASAGSDYLSPSALSGYATQSWVTSQGYLTSITSSQVTTALGYTPYNSSNPSGYITSAALSGYATQSWVTSQGYITGVTNISGYSYNLYSQDIRTIAPSSHGSYRLNFGFTSWANNNSSPYADYLHFRSYSDGSGGADNLVMFLKSGIGMRIWQQSFGSASAYSSYVDVLHSSNYNSYSPTLTGGGASGTWGISITGNADTVDGYHASTSTIGNYIVVRDGNGYIFGNYINMTDNSVGSGVTGVIVKQGDNYYRTGTAGAIQSFLGLGSMAYASTGSYLPLSGGTMTGQIYGPTIGTGVYDGFIQVREYGYVGSGQSSWAYAPAITYHWGNRTVVKVGVRADGLFAIDDQPFALRSWVTSQGYVTGSYLPLSGGTLTNTLNIGTGGSTNAGLLNVTGSTHNQVNITNGSGWGMLLGFCNEATIANYHGPNAAAIINVQDGPLHLGTNNSSNVLVSRYGQLLINASSSGYGSNNYGYNLGVRGNSSQAYISVAINNQTLDTQGLIVGIDTTAGRFHLRDNKSIIFATNDQERVWINSGGALLVNTSTQWNYERFGVQMASSSNWSNVTAIMRLTNYVSGGISKITFTDSSIIDGWLGMVPISGGSYFAMGFSGYTEQGFKVFQNGNTNVAGTNYAAAYRGNANVAGTGEATYHPAGIYSTGTNWLYGTMYVNNNSIYDVYQITHTNASIKLMGNFHLDSYNGNEIYLNYYSAAAIRLYGTTRQEGNKFLLLSDSGGYGQFQINSSNTSTEATMVFGSGGSGQNSGQYTYGGVIGLGAYGNSKANFYFGAGYSGPAMFIPNSSAYVQAINSFRAPIFYDSDDTGYYMDPNGLTNISRLTVWNASNGASVLIGSNDTSRVYADDARKAVVINAAYYPHLYINATAGDAGNTTHGAVISMTGRIDGGYRRWGMGIANYNPNVFSIGYADNNSNPHYGVGGDGWSQFWITTSGNTYSSGSFRAPIFYDSNDTSYYGDFASTSRMAYITLNQSTGAHNHMTYGGYFSGGDWQSLTNTEGQLNVVQVNNINGGQYSNQAPNVYTYGGILSWRTLNHSFQLYASHTGDITFKTQWGNDNYSGWRRILHESNYTSFAIARGGDTLTGIFYFRTNNGGYLGSLSSAPLQAYSDSNNSAYMSFHKGGYYAVNFGLDQDNWMRIGGWSASSNRWQLNLSNGDMYAAGDITAYSDARVKTNIFTIENPLEKTLLLRGVTYTRTDSDDKKTKMGVIAQEVLEIIPEVVNQDNNGTYSVAYGNMVGLLIESIKEQQKQIEELKSIIDGLTK